MKTYRVLICGAGSVGERHLGNLLALGQTEVALLRQRGHPLRVKRDKITEYFDRERALAEFKPEVVVVANLSAQHLETALWAALAGCHVFLEKPASDRGEGLAELERTLQQHRRHGMVGYMLRFHPLLQKVKAWLEEGEAGTLGRPLYLHASWGEHVPDWHPWENYAESYAVRRDMGGGAALTYSHDLDLCLWMFGAPATAMGCASQVTELAGDAEHGFDLLLRYPAGFNAHLHADYFTRPAARRWELTATRGRVIFDYYAGTLTRFDGVIGEVPPVEGPRAPVAEIIRVPAGFDRNDMFLAELRYFFECLDADRPPQPGIREGARVVQLALAARATGVWNLPSDPFAPLT